MYVFYTILGQTECQAEPKLGYELHNRSPHTDEAAIGNRQSAPGIAQIKKESSEC